MKAFCEKCFKEVEVGPGARCPVCGRDLSEERKKSDRGDGDAGRMGIDTGKVVIALVVIALMTGLAWWFLKSMKPYDPSAGLPPVPQGLPAPEGPSDR